MPDDNNIIEAEVVDLPGGDKNDRDGKPRHVNSERGGGSTGSSGSKGKGGKGQLLRRGWDWGKKGAGKAWNFSKSTLLTKTALVRCYLPLTVAFIGLEVFDRIRKSDPVLHKRPEPGRTKYLPVSGVGTVDTPADYPEASVDALDAQIDEVNDASFQFDPDVICWYCEHAECGGKGDCRNVADVAGAVSLDPDAAVALVGAWATELEATYDRLRPYAGEMWVNRMMDKYGSGGRIDIASIVEHTEDVADALTACVEASEEMGASAYASLRGLIRWGREEMQQRLDNNDDALGWLYEHTFGGTGADSQEQLRDAANRVQAAMAENDKAVSALDDALGEWDARQVGIADTSAGGIGDMPTQSKTAISNPGTPATAAPVGAGAGGVTAAPSDDKPRSFIDDLTDKLAGLGTPESPFSSPLGGMGGGMPDMGSGAPLPGGSGNPLGANGLTDALKPAEGGIEDEDKEPLEPAEGGIEDEDKEALEPGEGGFEDENVDDVIEETDDAADEDEGDTEPAPEETGEEAPVEVDPAAAVTPADPNSEEARTVTLPDGRQITFPDAKSADMVRALSDAPGSMSVRNAAYDAGFDVPAEGQDIGNRIPPSDMRPGDVVVTAAGDGVYMGNDEVLMDDGSVKSRSDLSFEGTRDGVFRLIDPDNPNASVVEGAGQAVDGGGVDSGSTPDPSAPQPVEETTESVPDESPVSPMSADGALGSGTSVDPLMVSVDGDEDSPVLEPGI